MYCEQNKIVTKTSADKTHKYYNKTEELNLHKYKKRVLLYLTLYYFYKNRSNNFGYPWK